MENAVSNRLLAGEFGEGDAVRVDLTLEGYAFSEAEAATAAAYEGSVPQQE